MPDRGWFPDHGAIADLSYFRFPVETKSLPEVPDASYCIVDDYFGSKAGFPLYDRSRIFHACAASAVAAAIEIANARRARGDGDDSHHVPRGFQPSIRFLYYVGRYLQLRERENDGASIYATLRAAQILGFCDE